MHIGADVPKIVHFSSSFSNRTVANKKTIPKSNELVNWANAIIVLGEEILVPINTLANQAAEILIDNPENACNQGRY